MELEVFTGSVVGVSFEPAKTNLKKFVQHLQSIPEDEIKPEIHIEHQPENEYDKNAVRVVARQEERTWELGWLPKEIAKRVVQICGIGNCKASMIDFNVMEDVIVGLTIKVVQITETNVNG